jgi:MFS family permease
VIVSLLWFALSAQWMTVVPIIVPDQVTVILGGDSAAKEAISGTILAAGAVEAFVVAPLSGALSVRSQHRRGRRRLFLIAGVLSLPQTRSDWRLAANRAMLRPWEICSS